MKKSFYILMITGIALVLMLSACKDDDDLDELEENVLEGSTDVNLDFRHTQVEEWGELRRNHMEDIIDQVEEDNENVTIELNGVDHQEAMSRLEVEMLDGDPPNIFELNMFGDQLEEYVDDGNLLDLTDFLEENGLKDEFLNLDAYTIDDRVYGLPFEGMVSGFYYNKEVLDELGGKPETWDDFIDIIEAGVEEDYTPLLTQAMGIENMHYTSMFQILLQRTAGNHAMDKLIQEDAKWTDDEMVASLERFKELTESDAFKAEDDMEDPTAGQDELAFAAGEDLSDDEMNEMMEDMEEMQQEPYKKLLDGDVLFIYDQNMASMSPDDDDEMMGGSGYGIVAMAEEEGKEDMIDNIGFMALPEIPGGSGDQSSLQAEMMDGYGFGGNISDEEEEAVYKFIEAFWSEESMDRVAKDDGMIPARKIDNISSMDNPIQQEILDAIHEADETFGGMESGGSMMQIMLMEDISRGLKDIADDKEDPAHVAENLQSTTENLIDQMKDQEEMGF